MSEQALVLNRERIPLDSEHRASLADFLRNAGANSIHLGCEHGVCGACNVILDGACIRSCLTMAHTCSGSTVTTLEGLHDELAQRLKSAFSKHHALQCGFCTPGVFVAAYDLISMGIPLDEHKIRTHMAGNICRCTGYQGIVDAILDVATQILSDNPVEEV